jgi:hypothetical protein
MQIQMAAGPDGGLYVSIPAKDGNARFGGSVVVLLGGDGRPRPGWPIRLADVDSCGSLLPVADGSVRVVCSGQPRGGDANAASARAFAFDSSARAMPGWPVDIEDGSDGRMVGDDLTMLANRLLNVGGEAGELWPVALVVIEPDGRVRKGVEVPFACCDSAWAVGPDGIAYGTTHRDWSSATSVKTDVTAFGPDGPRPGWPVTIDGNASELMFDARGRVYLVVGSPSERPARTVVLDKDGRTLPSGSAVQAIVSTSTWNGAGDANTGPPIVADDGSAFLVSDEEGGTTVIALDPNGEPRAGWPFRSSRAMEWLGFCGEGDTGCGQSRTMPRTGNGHVLYLLHAAASASTGGSILAINPDGRVRAGWPVGLKRAGSMFFSMAVDPAGGAWALAVEPERPGYSATIVSIARDSTVRFTTTIVQP